MGIIIAFLLRKKRAKAQTTDQATTPELEDQEETLAKRKWFLKGRWRSEVEAKADPQELDSKNIKFIPGPPVELEALEVRPAEQITDEDSHVRRSEDETTRR
jgi:hypothetical protein